VEEIQVTELNKQLNKFDEEDRNTRRFIGIFCIVLGLIIGLSPLLSYINPTIQPVVTYQGYVIGVAIAGGALVVIGLFFFKMVDTKKDTTRNVK